MANEKVMSVTAGWRKNEMMQQMRKRTNAIASSVTSTGVFFFIMVVVYVMLDNLFSQNVCSNAVKC